MPLSIPGGIGSDLVGLKIPDRRVVAVAAEVEELVEGGWMEEEAASTDTLEVHTAVGHDLLLSAPWRDPSLSSERTDCCNSESVWVGTCSRSLRKC